MPGPEHRGGHSPEHEPSPYTRAARFAGERPAGLAYRKAEAAIFGTPCDLSVYRLQFQQRWHVAVLGELPPDEFAQRIDAILATGEPTTLPSDVMRVLQQRRAELSKRRSWTEGHYRPGTRL